MGDLAKRVLRDMNEALTAEENGTEINFVPSGCVLRYMGKSASKGAPRYNLDLPRYGTDKRNFPLISIIFTGGPEHQFSPPILVDGGAMHHLSQEEDDVLDNVHLWLTMGEHFNESKE